ncbi:MAG: hypothetical protein ACYTGL_29320, partial [Planctomycetota bacterium]
NVVNTLTAYNIDNLIGAAGDNEFKFVGRAELLGRLEYTPISPAEAGVEAMFGDNSLNYSEYQLPVYFNPGEQQQSTAIVGITTTADGSLISGESFTLSHDAIQNTTGGTFDLTVTWRDSETVRVFPPPSVTLHNLPADITADSLQTMLNAEFTSASGTIISRPAFRFQVMGRGTEQEPWSITVVDRPSDVNVLLLSAKSNGLRRTVSPLVTRMTGDDTFESQVQTLSIPNVDGGQFQLVVGSTLEAVYDLDLSFLASGTEWEGYLSFQAGTTTTSSLFDSEISSATIREKLSELPGFERVQLIPDPAVRFKWQLLIAEEPGFSIPAGNSPPPRLDELSIASFEFIDKNDAEPEPTDRLTRQPDQTFSSTPRNTSLFNNFDVSDADLATAVRTVLELPAAAQVTVTGRVSNRKITITGAGRNLPLLRAYSNAADPLRQPGRPSGRTRLTAH